MLPVIPGAQIPIPISNKETHQYLMCTPAHGIQRGSSIIIGITNIDRSINIHSKHRSKAILDTIRSTQPHPVAIEELRIQIKADRRCRDHRRPHTQRARALSVNDPSGDPTRRNSCWRTACRCSSGSETHSVTSPSREGSSAPASCPETVNPGILSLSTQGVAQPGKSASLGDWRSQVRILPS